jgi:hypothetical protein
LDIERLSCSLMKLRRSTATKHMIMNRFASLRN